MKLVAWLGGPEVVEDMDPPHEYICFPTEEEWNLIFSIDAKDADCFLPLEVDE